MLKGQTPMHELRLEPNVAHDEPSMWPSSLERYQSIVQNAVEGIFQSSPDGRFLLVNPALARMYGYDSPEHLMKSVHDISLSVYVDPDIRNQFRRQMERDGEVHGLEYQVRRRDGGIIWVSEHSRSVRNERGEVLYYEGFVQDITLRKRAEDELRASKETAESASRAKSQFLAVMSHEIRTPMNGVIGMTSLLLGSPLTAEQRELAETIRQSGDALLNIINDILDFSKIESGRIDLENEEFDLHACAESSLDLLAARAAEKRLDLLCDIADGTPALVRGDVTRLRQVIVNLLSNAVKFTEQGEVLLSVHGESRPDGKVVLHVSVKDTGIGISADAMGRLFQSFSQADASTTRRYGGTGLGLAISKRLAEFMGGSMSADSKPGDGSTFRFNVVVESVPGAPHSHFAAARSQLGGRRLLIVDDNATHRRILTKLTNSWHLYPHAVETGAEALRLLRAGQRFDFALIDMELPEIDGFTLAHAIRELRPAPDLPLIVLTSPGKIERTNNENLFAACLSKPVKPTHLFNSFVDLVPRPRADPAKQLPTPPANLVYSQPERVLLAEDNSVNQKVALRMLARLGYRADLASNGHEVFAAVRSQSYDVILMDVAMPEMDGLEATRKIRAMTSEKSRPWIVALTANAMQGDRELCLAAGMDDYIRKPIKLSELAAALRQARAIAAA
jgi:PAS domain S-box-containing protein